MTTLILPDTKDLDARINPRLELAQRFAVSDAATYELAAELIQVNNGLLGEIDRTFDPSIASARETLEKIRSAKKTHAKPLEDSNAVLNDKRRTWFIEDERARKAEADRIEAEARAAEQKRRDQEAEALKQAGRPEEAAQVSRAPMPAPPPAPEAPKASGSSTKRPWTYRIIDESKIPDQYWVLDESAIAAVVKKLGQKAGIPGVEVFLDVQFAYGGRKGGRK